MVGWGGTLAAVASGVDVGTGAVHDGKDTYLVIKDFGRMCLFVHEKMKTLINFVDNARQRRQIMYVS